MRDTDKDSPRPSDEALTAGLTPTGSWRVDLTHSSVGFEVRHMMIATVHGRFDDFEGSLTTDAAGALKAVGVIRAASINTNEDSRDAHLRSADFFAVDEYPQIRFASTGIERVKGGAFRVAGLLTIKDVTRPIELDVDVEGTGIDPWGNERVGLRATGQIDRTDFGLLWNKALEAGGMLVADKVRLVIDISAVKATGAEATP
jgi:polyisoprenoid-binding protein YceI